ncbi:hypothetical protein MSCUN_09500 [Methanosphaera cuniculi]|uniref:Uncharacterized protein n=2 Tax=Methanosphaera cuniculi TaxID=1077256 RepID=A0A2V2BPW9_9EURY|nr:hypothetical protein MSCUN_09500 [Methanosphaera cuniculi]
MEVKIMETTIEVKKRNKCNQIYEYFSELIGRYEFDAYDQKNIMDKLENFTNDVAPQVPENERMDSIKENYDLDKILETAEYYWSEENTWKAGKDNSKFMKYTEFKEYLWDKINKILDGIMLQLQEKEKTLTTPCNDDTKLVCISNEIYCLGGYVDKRTYRDFYNISAKFDRYDVRICTEYEADYFDKKMLDMDKEKMYELNKEISAENWKIIKHYFTYYYPSGKWVVLECDVNRVSEVLGIEIHEKQEN